MAIVVEAKRRRTQAADSQPKFVPPNPSDTRPKPEKPVFAPPLPKPKVVGVAVEHFVPSFLVAPVDTTTSVNTRVLVYTDNEGKHECKVTGCADPVVVLRQGKTRVLVYTDTEGNRQRKIMGCDDAVVLHPTLVHAEGSLPTPLPTKGMAAAERAAIRWRKLFR